MKEMPTADVQLTQRELIDEPKETDRMLQQKEEEITPNQDISSSTTTNHGGHKATDAEPQTVALLTTPKEWNETNAVTVAAAVKNSKTTSSPKSLSQSKKTGEEIIHIAHADESNTDLSNAVFNDKEKKATVKAGDADGDGDDQPSEIRAKKIPIGGFKLPEFFMKTKQQQLNSSDGVDGELLEKEHKDDNNHSAADTTTKSLNHSKHETPVKNLGQRLRQFFIRKSVADKQQQQQQQQQQQKQHQQSSSDVDNKSETTAEIGVAGVGEGLERNNKEAAGGGATVQKRGLLNAIKLPLANMIPKKVPDDDVELGMSKAGLASMETLDDSLKDHDCNDKAIVTNNCSDDNTNLEKAPSGEITLSSGQEKSPNNHDDGGGDNTNLTFCQRLRSYRCSIDDALITLGILLFVVLIAVIGFVLSRETLISPLVRKGGFIDAVASCGMVEGIKEDGAFAFRGIPYALPPIGERRWRSAQAIENIDDCWNGTLKAHNSSDYCTQLAANGTIIGVEDCLYLDIITPSIRYDNLLPVIVMIGADSLIGPSPGILRPSARYSRSNHVLYVRPNFRLGPFGFLSVKALSDDSYPHTSGNYALSDIIAALKWIQLNIAYFGGDRNSITLWGHRAGGTLVNALITSKKAAGLYTRAWVSSASSIYPGKPLVDSEKRNEEIMLALNCENANCLRNKSVEDIWTSIPTAWKGNAAEVSFEMNATNYHEWLVLDGDILQEHPAETWKKEHPEKPVLVMGTTAHESHNDQLYERFANFTSDEIRHFLESSQIGALNLTDDVIQNYNATDYRSLIAIISDISTICPLLINARSQSNVPFYVVTLGGGKEQLATVDADVQAILGRYEPHTVQQGRYVSSMQQIFYYYVAHGTVPQYEPRRIINIAQDPLSQKDYPNCNYWISNDIVPRYARID